MGFEGVPGVVEAREAHGETTLVVDSARLLETCRYLRDELGFVFPLRRLGGGLSRLGPRDVGLLRHRRRLRHQLPRLVGPLEAARGQAEAASR